MTCAQCLRGGCARGQRQGRGGECEQLCWRETHTRLCVRVLCPGNSSGAIRASAGEVQAPATQARVKCGSFHRPSSRCKCVHAHVCEKIALERVSSLFFLTPFPS